MAFHGTQFAKEIQRAAVAWGWNYVGRTTELFASHYYCRPSATRWFTTFELSRHLPGQRQGHGSPNPAGYQGFAQHLYWAVVAHRDRQPL